jgi:hypothetical protein
LELPHEDLQRTVYWEKYPKAAGRLEKRHRAKLEKKSDGLKKYPVGSL